ncbi:MAG TPA: hypothetical protein VG318_01060 [Actinomycetota bacterium]|nr:hypothetical protein [Actinomycetota bacterium]
MGELENGVRGPRGRIAGTVLAAFLLAGGTGVAVSSLDDVGADPPAMSEPETPAPSPPPPKRRAEPKLVVSGDAPTVYDSMDDVRECAASRKRFPRSRPDPSFEDDVDRISSSVEQIRKLDFKRRVDAHVVPAEEVGRRFANGIARQYSPLQAEADRRWMSVLRLAPEDVDLRTLAVDVARTTAAGFYSPRRHRLYSRSTGGVLTPTDEVVLAHELDHALVDQVLRIPGTLSRDPMLSDVMLAHQALVEGDATLVMSRYGAGTLDRAALDAFLRRFSSPQITGYPGVPWYLQRTSGFPYFEGLLFACGAWRDGGWRAIDRMYRKPPASSAEIVFPWRYEERAAGELSPTPPAPGRKWKQMTVAAFGAFDLMLMLENSDLLATGRADAGGRVDEVRGWNGGVMNVWFKGAATAVHLSFLDAGVTKDGRRSRRLCGVLRGWLARTFPEARRTRPGADRWVLEDGHAGLRCAGPSVELAIAPAPKLVHRVLRP